jgi:hypothetical protein
LKLDEDSIRKTYKNKYRYRYLLCILFVFVFNDLSAQKLEEILTEPFKTFFGSFDIIETGMRQYSAYTGSYAFKGSKYWIEYYKDIPRAPSSYNILPSEMLNDEYFEEGEWSSFIENGFLYIAFKSGSASTFRRKLGVLAHKRRLYLYDNNELLFASGEDIRMSGYEPKIVSIKSSSHLAEKKKKYTGENFVLGRTKDNIPWVEGVKGSGINEWIELTLYPGDNPVDALLISNGYVDFTRPQLYRANNRVKVLQIEVLNTDIVFSVTLNDTYQFQEIRMPKRVTKATKIRLTIKEVYKGEKWDDTCINLVVPIFDLQ